MVSRDHMPSIRAHEELRRRLGVYSQQIRLIAEQIEALDAGSLRRYHELAAERARIERDLPGSEAPRDDDGAHLSAGGLGGDVARALRDMEGRVEGDELVRARLQGLHDAALCATRGIEVRRPEGGQYQTAGRVPGRLDVRM